MSVKCKRQRDGGYAVFQAGIRIGRTMPSFGRTWVADVSDESMPTRFRRLAPSYTSRASAIAGLRLAYKEADRA